MNITKILTHVIVMMVVALSASAQQTMRDYNLLCNLRDGGSVLIKLPPRNQSSSSAATSSIVLSAKSVEICGDRNNPDESTYEFTFDKLDFSNPFSFVDSSYSSLETESVEAPSIILTPKGNGVVQVTGESLAEDAISVCDVSGRPVKADVENDGGVYVVSLAGSAAGVYIIEVSGVTIKVLKK